MTFKRMTGIYFPLERRRKRLWILKGLEESMRKAAWAGFLSWEKKKGKRDGLKRTGVPPM